MTSLSIRNLIVEKPRRRGTLTLVGPLDLDLRRGEILGLVGESGSGKTLTLRALAGIPPAGLEVRDSSGTYHPPCRTAMVFQDPMGFFNPRWRISRSLEEVLRVVRRVPAPVAPARAGELLEAVGLAREEGKLFPFEMSGGMVQRSAIAMALAVEPEVMLADEVTSALDPATRDRILQLLCRVGRERQVATIVVSHDLPSLAAVADRVIVLYGGRAIEEGSPGEILGKPRHRYTDLLVRSLPGRETRGAPLPEIPRDPAGDPILSSSAGGCPFARRCPVALARCHGELPDWSGEKNHRFRCFVPVRGEDHG
ncbi:MAG: ABC transporter ATP-binding protein [Spirochaetaceae bacterium]|nr:MAG: ABC transporter ATP-binding protein [Spirochaetaceae bacterium]